MSFARALMEEIRRLLSPSAPAPVPARVQCQPSPAQAREWLDRNRCW